MRNPHPPHVHRARQMAVLMLIRRATGAMIIGLSTRESLC